MATPFHGEVNSFQVGSYFVNHYYRFLQNHPHLVYQFYNDVSTMVRIDSKSLEAVTACGMTQIHEALTCLNLNGIEIKTANFLDSWNGGILVTVSGLVQVKDNARRRRFVQTIFLAPQEKGYFVLNDIFCLLDDEHDQHMVSSVTANTTNSDCEAKMQVPNIITEPGPIYPIEEVFQPQDFNSPLHEEESDGTDHFDNPEVQQQFPLESEVIIEETAMEDHATTFSLSANGRLDAHTPELEPMGELPKQTYASVLRAKGQIPHAISYPTFMEKTVVTSTDLPHLLQPTTRQPLQSVPIPEKTNMESYHDTSMPYDDGESLSVYVGNLSPSTSIFDLEHEFKNFGRIRPNSIAIRSRKEAGVFYGFVEFEDITGVHNALKASPIELNGRMIHVEERRANSGFSRAARGGGRGKPTGYTAETRDYNGRARGNGYQRRGGRRDSVLPMY